MVSGREIDREILVYKIEHMQIRESKTNWHFNVSMVKSGLRIIAGAATIKGEFVIAGTLLILAEVLGILEEV
jgi:hypothetical protein